MPAHPTQCHGSTVRVRSASAFVVDKLLSAIVDVECGTESARNGNVEQPDLQEFTIFSVLDLLDSVSNAMSY